jgi:hypothetical protein
VVSTQSTNKVLQDHFFFFFFFFDIWEMGSRSHTQRYVMVKTIEGK